MKTQPTNHLCVLQENSRDDFILGKCTIVRMRQDYRSRLIDMIMW